MSSLSTELISKAESFPGIKAGIARLKDILKTPSYQAIPEGEYDDYSASLLTNQAVVTEWPSNAKSVVVLGLHHPDDNPRLDWWDGGNTMGNRRLMKIADFLKQWLANEHRVSALPLPYYVEAGGLFLKDAAVQAGLGRVGRNNLLLNPEWGPRIRLYSALVEGVLEPTGPVEDFSPCESCGDLCHSACPKNAFSTGAYHRSTCIEQLNVDSANRMPDEEAGEDITPGLVIQFCRACEFACPVGT